MNGRRVVNHRVLPVQPLRPLTRNGRGNSTVLEGVPTFNRHQGRVPNRTINAHRPLGNRPGSVKQFLTRGKIGNFKITRNTRSWTQRTNFNPDGLLRAANHNERRRARARRRHSRPPPPYPVTGRSMAYDRPTRSEKCYRHSLARSPGALPGRCDS